jgi:uncharacterized membrane protein (DUF106 family)
MQENMQSLQPEIDKLETENKQAAIEAFMQKAVQLAKAQADFAKRARRKALRILIPFTIIACLALIGIGILIGKYIL